MYIKHIIYAVAVSLLLTGIYGCEQPKQDSASSRQLPKSGPISEYTELIAYSPIPVHGYGLVAGLNGTGSSECPPDVRDYLKQYILGKLSAETSVSADDLLNSMDTAAVKVEGIIPPAATKNDTFDIKVSAVAGTQTTSLKGGTLYTCDLMLSNSSRKLAKGQGPIYIDGFDTNDLRTGYVPGGGTSNDDYTISLGLFTPDYVLANIIRNSINERFGDSVANAPSNAIIHIKIPDEYKHQKQKFISLVRAIYIGESQQQRRDRAEELVKALSDPNKDQAAETALESIGRTEQDKILPLLKSDNAQTRFRAARCLLNMGNEEGVGILRDIAINVSSPDQNAAIDAIALDAGRNTAMSMLRPILSNDDKKLRVKVYEKLRDLRDPLITTTKVAGDFEIDEVKIAGEPFIYAYRSGQRRIVIFNGPGLSSEIFAQSPDGSIIITAAASDETVSIIRKHPRRNAVIGPVKAPRDIMNLLITMCEVPPDGQHSRITYGLGVPYSDLVAMLKTMCEKGAVNAQFDWSSLPKTSMTKVNSEKRTGNSSVSK